MKDISRLPLNAKVSGITISAMSIIALILYGLLCREVKIVVAGNLQPQDSESRQIKSLDGIWNFKLSPTKNSLKGYKEKWFQKELKDVDGETLSMPVPASYNDLTQDMKIRDYVGVVWYERKFFVPKSWGENQKVWLRFGSVTYAAQVWINGALVTSHDIGHLPFQEDVTTFLSYGEENLLTVAVDNTLLQTTIPQGNILERVIENVTYIQQTYTFDFFHYAGIDRPVVLYTTPTTYISDVTLNTDVLEVDGLVKFDVEVKGGSENSTASCIVEVLDKEGNVFGTNSCQGNITVKDVKLWWPYLMDPNPGYLYTLKVTATSDDGQSDIYRLPFGIRSLKWTNKEFLINGKPIYIRGIGKHEDSDIKGKGLDLSVVVKDFELLQWLGVNTFRTSHYPYAEEIMDMADKLGIMVIDECPSVDTDVFSSTLLQNHKRSLSELIQRDKNRPSVVIWSVSNEPRSHQPASELYFKQIVEHVKSIDQSRPTTIALARSVTEDKAAQFLDIVSFNRYNAWYSDAGRTEVIYKGVVSEAEGWYNKHQKPILMTEYGADAFSGVHIYPEAMWSEEFQILSMTEHFRAFDYLRSQGFFIGEMIWNFADFKTAQSITRVGGNKKGLFTRQRDPKSSAYYLRTRYHELANELEGVPLPKDAYKYTLSRNKRINRTEF